jgi:hypothetical protein
MDGDSSVRGDRSRPIERYTVREAADVLGISPEAVRNRITRSVPRLERESGRVFVLLEAGQSTDEPRPTADRSGDRPERVVEVLRSQVEDLREQLAQAHERDRENRRRGRGA